MPVSTKAETIRPTPRDAPGDRRAGAELGAEQVRAVGDQEDEGAVEAEHDRRENPGETLALGDQLLEARAVLNREVNAVVHCFCPRSTDVGRTRLHFMLPLDANQTTLVLDAMVFYRFA
jgi:hypothetical protein